MQPNTSSLSTNDDLKELCVLLDEERCKMHQLAEQWKHFGTTSIHKLETQIVDYQDKLNDLEERQVLLLKENDALKTLVSQLMFASLTHHVNPNCVYFSFHLFIDKFLEKILPRHVHTNIYGKAG